MNKTDLRVSRSIALLADLKTIAADFAKREEQLECESRARRTAASRKYYETLERLEASLKDRLEKTDGRFKKEEERLRERYQSRQKKIERAYAIAKKNVPKRAQEIRANWLGALQRRRFEAEGDRNAALKEIAGRYDDFAARLEDKRAALARLKRRARASFAGYWKFSRALRRAKGEPVKSGELAEYYDALKSRLQTAEEALAAFRRHFLPHIFRFVPLIVWLLLVALGCGAWIATHGSEAIPFAAGAGAATLMVIFVLHSLGAKQSDSLARTIVSALADAALLYEAARSAAQTHRAAEEQRVQEQFDLAHAEVATKWGHAGNVERDFEKEARTKTEVQYRRIAAKNDDMFLPRLKRIAGDREERLQNLKNEVGQQKQSLLKAYETEIAAAAAVENEQWGALQTEWKNRVTEFYDAVNAMNADAAARFPQWSEKFVAQWSAPHGYTPDARFARLEVDLEKRAIVLPKDKRLALPGPSKISLPLALAFPAEGSLLLETTGGDHREIIATLNNLALRLLATIPPGKIAITIIDPVGLGQNFAGLMHLGDYEEAVINRRIWTQRDQIEERLAELNQHIEKVIQMYLRNEYATITEYNEQAGSVAEKYHFLVVADFPGNFGESAAKKLQSIITSGPRCGVFTLIHWDRRQPLPDGFVADDLHKSSVCIRQEKNGFVVAKEQTDFGATLVFDRPPNPELELELVHKIGKASIDSNRVEVPFSQIAPAPDEMWTGDTTNELRVAIGRTGATKLQMLAIGKGTRQHALFAGKTGSGKSTLFHVIITNLSLWCSPEQVEFYLIDFKKGVEFKCYAAHQLPHARVVAIESDREFGLSVLQRVDEELKRRGDIFRKLGVQDLAGYKKSGDPTKPGGGLEPMPRTLLLIDEFQEFFVDDDAIAQSASLLLDRIVRQGRAFGIHVLLGSQTLGGAYTLARATLGQMVIRVALQCNEADAYLIMDDNNPAPRLLSRPGEGIYNDSAGAIEGNSPFQVVWISDHERDAWLEKIRALALARRGTHPAPIVFEGNAPADVRENELLREVLASEPVAPPVAPRCWLGAPNSIKGPTQATFHRQSGSNLLVVGQRDEVALNLLGLSLLALGAQFPVAGGARFVFLHAAPPGSSAALFIEKIIASSRHEIVTLQNRELGEIIGEISAELKSRMTEGARANSAPPVFLFIHELQKFKKLRQEDDFSFSASDDSSIPSAQFHEILTEGPSHGIHILATVDTFNNVGRFISRKAMSEFEMRVVFQMSANDSASLIDSPAASHLGLHRALFYNEREGTLETFRPYAMPDAEWFRASGRKFAAQTA